MMPIIDYAITNRLTPFISMQNYYCLIYREEEREMFPTLNVRSLISLLHSSSRADTPHSFSAWAQSHGPHSLAAP